MVNSPILVKIPRLGNIDHAQRTYRCVTVPVDGIVQNLRDCEWQEHDVEMII